MRTSQKKEFWLFGLIGSVAAFFPGVLFAQSLPKTEHDPVATVILWVTLIFSMAIFGRYLARRFHQPGVLGELLMGVVLGNVCYYFGLPLIMVLREGSAIFSIIADLLRGLPLQEAVNSSIPNAYYASQISAALGGDGGVETIKIAYVLDMFSRFGVIFLLFMVGLESSVKELRNTGRESFCVAIIGVLLPILFGFVVAYLLLPNATYQANLFVAATLCATSIGISARVLTELKKLQTREARTILGAAVLDDILGLIILAVVSNIVLNGQVDIFVISQVIVSALLFFAGAIFLGPWVLRKSIHYVDFLDLWEAKLFISFVFVMALSWLATLVQLAAIIGAFAAGMIINDTYFETDKSRKHIFRIKDLVAPLEFVLAPLFFMLIGLQVKLESFFDIHVIIMASGLIIAAIVGKLLSGLGASRKDDRLLIGIGMMPRGEVGLVFASIGRTLGVMSDQLFSAVVLMIIVTTFIVPPLLKMRFSRHEKGVESCN